MQEISQKGKRTILLVSHNMASITKICTKCLVLKNGQVDFHGDTSTAVERYMNANIKSNGKIINLIKKQHKNIIVKDITINKNPLIEQVMNGDEGKINLSISFLAKKALPISAEAYLIDAMGKKIGFYCLGFMESDKYLFTISEGLHQLSATIDIPLLNKGVYYLSINLVHPNIQAYTNIDNAVRFTCLGTSTNLGKVFMSQKRGPILLSGAMKMNKISTKYVVENAK